MTQISDLLDACFGSGEPALRAEFEGWVRNSRRFRAFAESYRSKIRAKVRSASDEEGVLDVRTELAAAARLVHEEKFAVAYEDYAAAKQRGPDFTVVYKTHTPFNVEVRRIRGVAEATKSGAREAKLLAVLCDKVGQMPPSCINLLWLAADGQYEANDVMAAVTTLREQAECKVDELFVRRGFTGASDFLRQYRRLSGIFLWQPPTHYLWVNPLARHKTPPGVVAALQRIGATTGSISD